MAPPPPPTATTHAPPFLPTDAKSATPLATAASSGPLWTRPSLSAELAVGMGRGPGRRAGDGTGGGGCTQTGLTWLASCLEGGGGRGRRRPAGGGCKTSLPLPPARRRVPLTSPRHTPTHPPNQSRGATHPRNAMTRAASRTQAEPPGVCSPPLFPPPPPLVTQLNKVTSGRGTEEEGVESARNPVVGSRDRMVDHAAVTIPWRVGAGRGGRGGRRGWLPPPQGG